MAKSGRQSRAAANAQYERDVAYTYQSAGIPLPDWLLNSRRNTSRNSTMAKAKKYKQGSITLLGGNGKMPSYFRGGTGDLIGVDTPFFGPVQRKRRGRPRGSGSSRKLKTGPRRGLKKGEIALFDDVGMTIMSGGAGPVIGRGPGRPKGSKNKVGRKGITAAEKRMLAAYAKSMKAGKTSSRRGGRRRATAKQLMALAYGRAVRQAKLAGRTRPARPRMAGSARRSSATSRRSTTVISGDVKSAILELARKAKTAKKNMPGPVKTGLLALAARVKEYQGRYC